MDVERDKRSTMVRKSQQVPTPPPPTPKKLYEYNYVFAISNKMLLIYPSTDKDKESTRCLIIIKLMFTHVDMSQTAKEVSFRFFYSFLGKFSRYRCCQKQEVYVGTKSSVGLLYFAIFVFSKLVIIRYHSPWTRFRHFAVIPNHILGALK